MSYISYEKVVLTKPSGRELGSVVATIECDNGDFANLKVAGQTIPTNIVGADSNATLTNKKFVDNSTRIVNNVDETKSLIFDISGNTTGIESKVNFASTVNREYTFNDPGEDADIILSRGEQEIIAEGVPLTLVSTQTGTPAIHLVSDAGNEFDIDPDECGFKFAGTNNGYLFCDTDGIHFKFNDSIIVFTPPSISGDTTIISGTGLTLNNGQIGLNMATPTTAGAMPAAAFVLYNDATDANTGGTLIKRDINGDFSARNITATSFIGALTGNATGFTGSLAGHVAGTQGSTVIQPGVITNNMVASGAAIADTKLATIATPGKVDNAATSAQSATGANKIVLRDVDGNFAANIITATLNGNSIGFTGSLSGHVGGTQGATVIQPGVITNTMIADGALISDTKLATIAAPGKIDNAATTGTVGDSVNTLVLRSNQGNFAGNIITATLFNGPCSGSSASFTGSLAGHVAGTQGNTAIQNGVITNVMVASNAAIADTKLGTIATPNKVSNSATSAVVASTNDTIVLRDASGGFTNLKYLITDTGLANHHYLKTGANNRWSWLLSGNETGSNAGANIVLCSYNDGGISLATPFTIVRATGAATFSNSVTATSFIGPVTGNATGFTGSLSGVVTGTQGATTIPDGNITNAMLAQITASNKVADSATSATSANTTNSIIKRDNNGDFAARNATLTDIGAATIVTTGAGSFNSVASTTTVTGTQATFTAGSDTNRALSALSGNTSFKTSVGIGRTSVESDIGIVATNLDYADSSVIGDMVVKVGDNTKAVIIASGTKTIARFTPTTITAGTSVTFTGPLSGNVSGNLTGNVTGNVTGDVTGNVSGSAASFTGSLAGHVAGTQGNTSIQNGVITNIMVSASAAIADTKLATISTPNKVADSATSATSANTADKIMKRDTNGDFAARNGTLSTLILTTGINGNIAFAPASGNSYSYLSLVGGTSFGYFFGNQPALGQGIHMAYNYYINPANDTAVISSAATGTSRVTTGNNSVVIATGATNTAPTSRLLIDTDIRTQNGATFIGPLTGNVTGNVTGNLTGNVTGNVSGTVTTSSLLGNIVIGPASGNTYNYLSLPAGTSSSGFLFGNQTLLGAGIHLAYNYYADPATNLAVIPSSGSGTSRLSLGNSTITFLVGATNTAPSAILLLNDHIRAQGSATFIGALTGNVTGNLTGNVTGNVSGSAASFTGSLAGHVAGTQGSTVIQNNVIVDAMISSSAAIANSKLAVINTPGKVDNAATSAQSATGANKIVLRDVNGDFEARSVALTYLTGDSITFRPPVGKYNLLTFPASEGTAMAHIFADDNVLGAGAGTCFAYNYKIVTSEELFDDAAVGTSRISVGDAVIRFGTGGNSVSPVIRLLINTNIVAQNSAAFVGPLTGNVTGNCSGSAASFTGSLSGVVTGTQSATTIGSGAITNTMLAQITAANKVANSATTAQSATGADKIVLRDSSGDFEANSATLNYVTGNSVRFRPASGAYNLISFPASATGLSYIFANESILGAGTHFAYNYSIVNDEELFNEAGSGTSRVSVKNATIEFGTGGNSVSPVVRLLINTNINAQNGAAFVGPLTGNVTGNLTGNVTGNVSGSAASFTGSLAGHVAGTQGNTAIQNGVITNVMINSSAAIADSKLAQITSANKVADSATSATNLNTGDKIVKRDANGDFSARDLSLRGINGDISIGPASGNTYGRVAFVAGTSGAYIFGHQPVLGQGLHIAYNYYVDGTTATQTIPVSGTGTSRVTVGNNAITLLTGANNTNPSAKMLVDTDIRTQNSATFIGPLTGNVTGNLTGNVTTSVINGNVAFGAAAGNTYSRLAFVAGTSSAYLFGNQPVLGQGIHLAYNYSVDPSNNTEVITVSGTGTSRVTVGNNAITLLTGANNTNPSAKLLIDSDIRTQNSATFIGPLTGNVTGNLTGNVTTSVINGNVAFGPASGNSYSYLSLTGGSSFGYVFGNQPTLGAGIHMAYNFYVNPSNNAATIPVSATGTSRVSVSNNSIVLATGGNNTAPTSKLLIDTNITAQNSAAFVGPLTGNVTGNCSGSAASFTGSLSGVVTGTQSATTIANGAITNAMTTAASTNTNSAIVTRDSNGGFEAGVIKNRGGITGVNGLTNTYSEIQVLNFEKVRAAGKSYCSVTQAGTARGFAIGFRMVTTASVTFMGTLTTYVNSRYGGSIMNHTVMMEYTPENGAKWKYVQVGSTMYYDSVTTLSITDLTHTVLTLDTSTHIFYTTVSLPAVTGTQHVTVMQSFDGTCISMDASPTTPNGYIRQYCLDAGNTIPSTL